MPSAVKPLAAAEGSEPFSTATTLAIVGNSSLYQPISNPLNDFFILNVIRPGIMHFMHLKLFGPDFYSRSARLFVASWLSFARPEQRRA